MYLQTNSDNQQMATMDSTNSQITIEVSGSDNIIPVKENIVKNWEEFVCDTSTSLQNDADVQNVDEETENDSAYAITMDGESQGRIVRIHPLTVDHHQYQSLIEKEGNIVLSDKNIILQLNDGQNENGENNMNNCTKGAGETLAGDIPVLYVTENIKCSEENDTLQEHISKFSPRKSGRSKKSSFCQKFKLESITDKLLTSEMHCKISRRKKSSLTENAEPTETLVLVVSDSDDDLSPTYTVRLNKQTMKPQAKNGKKESKTRNERAHKFKKSHSKPNIDKKFKTTKALNSGIKFYSCRKCGKNYLSQDELKLHKTSHANERSHICAVCGKGFLTTTHLVRHSITHTTGRRIFSCNQCSRRFLSQTTLDLHLRVHAGERPYRCTKCDMGFTQQGHLLGHMQIHLEIKPFACTQERCNKTFARRSDLNNHIRTHTGEKPFLCTTCGKSFAQRGYMEIHAKGHLGLKPHACNVCGKHFTRKTGVTRHMLIHTGVKPYVCEVCGKGFAQSGQYKTHSRVHTGATPYSCDKCHKQFTQSVNRNKHMKKCTKVSAASICEDNINSGNNQTSDDIVSFQKFLDMDLPTKMNNDIH